MGITQGMEPAGRAPTVLGSPFPGIPGPCVQGRGHGGTPEHRETPPMGLSNLGVRDGVHREKEGNEQDFLSAAGSAPAGGLLFLCSPQLHPLLWGSWSGAASSPGCWRGAEPLGPAPCAWHLASLTSCGCAKGGGPQGRCGSTEGTPVLRVTPPRQGTGLAWGTHCSSPCPGEAGPPKCQGASAVPEQVFPFGICMSLDPSHCGCEKDVCPWGCWQAGWVSLPQLGQQGPAHLTTGTQSSSREPRCRGVHQGACGLMVLSVGSGP